jgi:O-antigen/teichoic acid export membrane protein
LRIARNYLAGLSNSVWSAIIAIAVVPFYLKYLGIESYGLIGFLTFTQGVVALLDFGLGPTISREVARGAAQGNLRDASELLHTLAVVYWATAAAILAVFLLAAPAIANWWLSTERLSPDVVSSAAMLIGVVIACRWPLGLYQGVLIGAQRLTTSSAINIAMVTAANVGGVAIVAFVSPTVQALFAWQAAVALVGSFAMRQAAWGVVRFTSAQRFSWTHLKTVWRFSVGVSLVAMTGIVLLQLDKGILSSMVGLDQFGRYMLAVLVANSLYVLLRPLFNTIYPRMSALVAANDIAQLADFYRTGTRLLASILFPIATTISLFARDLVFVWTGDATTAASVGPLVSLLVWGTALNGVMHFPYALQLAYGRTRLPLTINLALIALSAPITIALTSTYGVVGGAASWAILNAVFVCFGTWLTHRYLLPGIGARWLAANVIVPLTVSVIVVVATGWWIGEVSDSALLHVVLAAMATAVAILANISLDRSAVQRLLRSVGVARVLESKT